MRAHVIENGLVVNTIEVDSLDYMPNLVEATEGGIGWSYSNGVLTAPADTRTDAEIAEDVRAIRGIKLTETDWSALGDVAMTDEMKTYRQALRDVPTQAGFPNTIEWPTSP